MYRNEPKNLCDFIISVDMILSNLTVSYPHQYRLKLVKNVLLYFINKSKLKYLKILAIKYLCFFNMNLFAIIILNV